MNAALACAILILAALAQVTVSPLFTLSAAQPDLGLVALVVLAAATGPRVVMWGLPVFAVSAAFASNRDPAFVLLAYLPLLPLAYGIERSSIPLNADLRVLTGGLAIGLWARGMLAAEAVLDGADLAAGTLITGVMLPGMVLDFALLGIAWICGRLLGWEARTMALQFSRYQSR